MNQNDNRLQAVQDELEMYWANGLLTDKEYEELSKQARNFAEWAEVYNMLDAFFAKA